MARQPFRTKYLPNFIDREVADNLFNRLEKNTKWHDGIKKTRLAYRYDDFNDIDDDVFDLILIGLQEVTGKCDGLEIAGVYMNYYQDGKQYTPNHRHPDTKQLIISLGQSRSLFIGKKEYRMNSGDVIAFGSSTHGVPKEPGVTKARISIAVFFR